MTTSQDKDTQIQTPDSPVVMISICIAVVIGIVLLFVILYKLIKYKNQRRSENNDTKQLQSSFYETNNNNNSETQKSLQKRLSKISSFLNPKRRNSLALSISTTGKTNTTGNTTTAIPTSFYYPNDNDDDNDGDDNSPHKLVIGHPVLKSKNKHHDISPFHQYTKRHDNHDEIVVLDMDKLVQEQEQRYNSGKLSPEINTLPYNNSILNYEYPPSVKSNILGISSSRTPDIMMVGSPTPTQSSFLSRKCSTPHRFPSIAIDQDFKTSTTSMKYRNKAFKNDLVGTEQDYEQGDEASEFNDLNDERPDIFDSSIRSTTTTTTSNVSVTDISSKDTVPRSSIDNYATSLGSEITTDNNFIDDDISDDTSNINNIATTTITELSTATTSSSVVTIEKLNDGKTKKLKRFSSIILPNLELDLDESSLSSSITTTTTTEDQSKLKSTSSKSRKKRKHHTNNRRQNNNNNNDDDEYFAMTERISIDCTNLLNSALKSSLSTTKTSTSKPSTIIKGKINDHKRTSCRDTVIMVKSPLPHTMTTIDSKDTRTLNNLPNTTTTSTTKVVNVDKVGISSSSSSNSMVNGKQQQQQQTLDTISEMISDLSISSLTKSEEEEESSVVLLNDDGSYSTFHKSKFTSLPSSSSSYSSFNNHNNEGKGDVKKQEDKVSGKVEGEGGFKQGPYEGDSVSPVSVYEYLSTHHHNV